MNIISILKNIEEGSVSTTSKGMKFERLIYNYLQTDPTYAREIEEIWMWGEFPYRGQFGGHDIGIDIVVRDRGGEYWAVQCKCYGKGAKVEMEAVSNFVAASGKAFTDENGETKRFERRYWVDTLGTLTGKAAEQMKGQTPAVQRIGIETLRSAPVDWEAIYRGGKKGKEALDIRKKKTPKPHQQEAIEKAMLHFAQEERGMMVMACGTGKTYTSLRIAEEMKRDGKPIEKVLFLVPSIALMSQTAREWKRDTRRRISTICVCSDGAVESEKGEKGEKGNKGEGTLEDIAAMTEPATTNPNAIKQRIEKWEKKRKERMGAKDGAIGEKGKEKAMGANDGVEDEEREMLVVFCTYHSIERVAKAQELMGGEFVFDLAIADEAHRTTGVTLTNEDESAFVRIHDGEFIRARKRLYMTATPRVYSPEAQDKAKEKEAEIVSMDDKERYGETFYKITFGEAVRQDILADYKVIVLTVASRGEAETAADNTKDGFSEETKEWAKVTGAVSALSKISLRNSELLTGDDPRPMRTAVAFCEKIAVSKDFAKTFNAVEERYTAKARGLLRAGSEEKDYVCAVARHVDGKMDSTERNAAIEWLRQGVTEAEVTRTTTVKTITREEIRHEIEKKKGGLATSAEIEEATRRIRETMPDIRIGRSVNKEELRKYLIEKEGEDYATEERIERMAGAARMIAAEANRAEGRMKMTIKGMSEEEMRREEEAAEEWSKTMGEEGMQMVAENDGEGTRMEMMEGDGESEEERMDGEDVMVERTECRILTNVRCLSEGVDVPALDAAIFLNAKDSQVEIIQAVGRVMRKHEGKKYGYLIIPVVVTDPEATGESDAERASKLLDANAKAYQIVWKVISALRSHDEDLGLWINNPDLTAKSKNRTTGGGKIIFDYEGEAFDIPEYAYRDAILARMVQKVGDRRYWVQWAQDIATIVGEQTRAITRKIEKDEEARERFGKFVESLREIINDSITEQAAIEMLSQQRVTKPVFEALFDGARFVGENPVSKSLDWMIDQMGIRTMEEEQKATMEKFAQSVRERARAVRTREGRQELITNLYDSFFKNAFPKMVEQLGIVYTPVEVVDFIIRSVEEVLRRHFGKSMTDEGVNIIDPFTGTGTFIVRLLESGIIRQEDIRRKYEGEIYANEIVLLAYYIAAINIENAFHTAVEQEGVLGDREIEAGEYYQFEGLCLTDTFRLYENRDRERRDTREAKDRLMYVSSRETFPITSRKLQEQNRRGIQVVIGNPPYSVGQRSANDNAQNLKYPALDKRIEETYARESTAGLKKGLYDSYIRAFRMATDRIDERTGGVVGFVTNGSWLDSNSSDGFRKSIEREFSHIYVFNLRGNQRTSGELSKKEGGKIFGSGSRAPIAITILVKEPAEYAGEQGNGGRKGDGDAMWMRRESDDGKMGKRARIYYRDIGDYLTRAEKLRIVKEATLESLGMEEIVPNEHGDWISVRNEEFDSYIQLGNKDDKENREAKFFNAVHTNGLVTNRDVWCYNSSKEALQKNMSSMIDFYNEQREEYHRQYPNKDKKVIDFVNGDETKIHWTDGLRMGLYRDTKCTFSENNICTALYRPFQKQLLYADSLLNERQGIKLKAFPTPNHENLVIMVCGVSANKDFSCIMSDCIIDIQAIMNGQCFPLYYYEKKTVMFGELECEGYERRDGVSDWILGEARRKYGDAGIGKEDVFYYVYGYLHNGEYRAKYAADLKKMLPRLPLVETGEEFWRYSEMGRRLGKMHAGYEEEAEYACEIVEREGIVDDEYERYRVEKMRFGKKGKEDDKSVIVYNGRITVRGIPMKAYEYVVNGKSAVEWVMERYQVRKDKESGIVNDPNEWARERGDARYVLGLLLRVVGVSVRTVEIVGGN